MRRLLSPTALLAALSLAACTTEVEPVSAGSDDSSSTPSEPELAVSAEDAIQDAFQAFQQACASKDGAAAHALLAPATRDRWSDVKGFALHAQKDELKRQGIVTQLHVLVLRAKAGFEAIEGMDDVGLTQYALDNNLLGGQLVLGKRIEALEIEGDAATSGSFDEVARQESNIRFGFAKEGGAWKVDLVPTYTIADDIMHAKLATEGFEDEDRALWFLVGRATGTGGTPDLWKPLSETLGD